MAVDSRPLAHKARGKSRQIGFSWATAYDIVRQQSRKAVKLDSWISSRDEIQARLFLQDCRKFAGLLNIAASEIGERVYKIDEARSVTAFEMSFANGTVAHSMSSNPDAQAGKRGTRVLDEFALHQNPQVLYSIALPGITWGGQMAIVSTHRGAHNFFNKLVQEARYGENKKRISLHRVSLQDALDDGFLWTLQQKLPEGDERQEMDEAAYLITSKTSVPTRRASFKSICASLRTNRACLSRRICTTA